jgi:Macrocin-O-methyltransferase (TylF)
VNIVIDTLTFLKRTAAAAGERMLTALGRIMPKGKVSRDNYLPEFMNISRDLRNNRSIYDGYVRGWGIQFGDLKKRVRQDPLYQEALALAKGRTIITEENRLNLFLLAKFYLGKVPFGHIVEFGSYKGGNAIFLAYVVSKLYPGVNVYALDTFAGMPETDSNVDAHKAGDFSDVDLDELRSYAAQKGITNLHFVKGLFHDTAPDVLKDVKQVALAHIDCDIYSAVAYSYDVVKEYMVPGGYIVFDDATVSSCLGATDAVETLAIRRDGLSSEQIYPQYVFRAFFQRA